MKTYKMRLGEISNVPGVNPEVIFKEFSSNSNLKNDLTCYKHNAGKIADESNIYQYYLTLFGSRSDINLSIRRIKAICYPS